MTDKANIEMLFKRNYSRMFALAFSLLKEKEAAKDAVHDLFADILSDSDKADSDKEAGPLDITDSYLLRSVRNRCLNILRDLSTRERIGDLIRMESSDITEDSESDREERLRKIRRIILNELPTQCSRTMRLRFEEGLSYQEIAEEMDISKVAVYKHLRNGLEIIRKNINN